MAAATATTTKWTTMKKNQSVLSMFILHAVIFCFFLLIIINTEVEASISLDSTGTSMSRRLQQQQQQQTLLTRQVLNDITTRSLFDNQDYASSSSSSSSQLQRHNSNSDDDDTSDDVFTPLFVPLSTTDVLDAIDDFDDDFDRRSQDDLGSSTSITTSSSDINEAAATTSSTTRGRTAWVFLRGLATSPTFVRQVWQQRPLLIRSEDIVQLSVPSSPSSAASSSSSSWIDGCFTLDTDLREGVDQSFISGMRTADVLRNGTKTDTWQLEPIVDNNNSNNMGKSKSTAPTTERTKWEDVRDAINGGTVYFNTAGGLWPKLATL